MYLTFNPQEISIFKTELGSQKVKKISIFTSGTGLWSVNFYLKILQNPEKKLAVSTELIIRQFLLEFGDFTSNVITQHRKNPKQIVKSLQRFTKCFSLINRDH